jgi:hypothetical protein
MNHRCDARGPMSQVVGDFAAAAYGQAEMDASRSGDP